MLEISGVTVDYGAVRAIDGVSIRINVGEIVAIIGANGAGKTTLLRTIAGIESPRQGSIRFLEEDITRVPAHVRLKKGLALSPEGRGIFGDQTVYENLLLGAHTRRSEGTRVQEMIQAEYRRFPKLQQRANQLAGTLSGGEQQMLALSRALVSEPRLLMLDEPSLGLAPQICEVIFDSIDDLRRSGMTILLVEQMANQALAVADRAYVLETGRIRVEGTGAELLENPQVQAAYLGMH